MRVVAGLLESEFSAKHFLIGKRKDSSFDGHWEFPGGKKEPYEDDEDALVRELKEELGIDVRVCCEAARWSDPPNYPDFEIILYRVFLKKHSNHPVMKDEHSELKFAELRSINENLYLPTVPALRPLTRYILEHTYK